MMAASVIKKYLEATINKSKIGVWKLRWKQVSTSSSNNSGFHVFKEFLYHAQVDRAGERERRRLFIYVPPSPARKKIGRTFHGF
jgi:hypothetical protein